MDLETIKLLWNGLLTLVILLLGWNWQSINKRMDDIDMRHSKAHTNIIENYTKALEATANAHTKLQETITNVQIHYVHKDDLRSMRIELMDRFDRLENLVNKKNRE